MKLILLCFVLCCAYGLHVPDLANMGEPISWYDEHYKEITKDLSTIDVPRSSSILILLNDKCFSITNNGDGEPTVAAGVLGTGRYVVLPRVEYLYRVINNDITTLISNAAKWLANGKKLTIGSNTADSLFGFEKETLKNIGPSQLVSSGINVYVVNGYSSYSAEEIALIYSFVSNGGGLIIGAQAWSFPYERRVLEFAANKILGSMGVIISGYNYAPAVWTVGSSMKKEYNLYYALSNTEDDIALKTITSQLGIVVNSQTINLPLVNQIVNGLSSSYASLTQTNKKKFCKYANVFLYVFSLMRDFDWSIVKSADDVEQFPYNVNPMASKVTRGMTIKGTHGSLPSQFMYASSDTKLMMSTGMYAPPGSTIFISFPRDVVNKVEVTIGSHTDNLYNYHSLSRSPQISFTYSVTSTDFKAANPWGGLIYIRIAPGSTLGNFGITISKSVLAPYFVLGTTTDSQWNDAVKNYAGPWTELEAPGNLILTLPTSVAKTLTTPSDLMIYWNRVMMSINEFAGFPNNQRVRTERLVVDTQIDGGYMHAGYPIMGQMDLPSGLINYESLNKTGSWGVYHEIGHNHQWKSWTVDANMESCNNLWATYVFQKLYGDRYGQENLRWTKWRLIDFSFKERPANMWNVWLAFDSYIVLADEYGLNSYSNLFKKYYTLPEIDQAPEKLDTWARLYSQEVNTDLCDYFSWFRFPLTEATRTLCSTLPKARVDLLANYKIPIFTTTCPTGWFPYGDSCFIISEDKLSWNDAKVKCEQMQFGATLASCLTIGESEYISKRTPNLGSIFLGITNAKTNTNNFLNFDGSSAGPDTVKWANGYPKSEPNQCAKYDGSNVNHMSCTTISKYMCKLGPTSCNINIMPDYCEY